MLVEQYAQRIHGKVRGMWKDIVVKIRTICGPASWKLELERDASLQDHLQYQFSLVQHAISLIYFL